MGNTVRPTKKQRELLTFIEQFIGEHGYSPSYREVMSGLNYTSVATVALHINNLIKRGHLRKRDHSARSLEVVGSASSDSVMPSEGQVQAKPADEKWLVEKIELLFKEIEGLGDVTHEHVEKLKVLVNALRVLDLEPAAQNFLPRLATIEQKITS